MIIEIINGDLFKSQCVAWVNTVNCVGVSGKGIALEFKNRFPKNYISYKEYCSKNLLKPGGIFTHAVADQTGIPALILNLATKNHWRNPSKIEWIVSRLDNLAKFIKFYDIESIALPALGCSNGQLRWKDVRPLTHDKLGNLKTEIELYAPL